MKNKNMDMQFKIKIKLKQKKKFEVKKYNTKNEKKIQKSII